MDGRYDLPSGHVERDEPLLEAAVRELHEETGVAVNQKSLRLWHINQFAANGQFYYNFFFVADKWRGKPAIQEVNKCDDVQFFSLGKLPKMTAATHLALAQPLNAATVTFGYINQATYDVIAGD